MSRLEILCVTMNMESVEDQYRKMNIHCDTVFANQTDVFKRESLFIGGNRIQVISTDTKGNGLNRNIALLAASNEICLLSDDDMCYVDNLEEIITNEFDMHPDYDVIIFNIDTSTPEFGRIPKLIKKEGRMHLYSRNPFGAPRIAFRLESLRKTPIAFSMLFGGGSKFSNGQDSLFLRHLLKNNLKVFLSTKMIGSVAFDNSSWFSFDNEKKAYGKGAIIEASPINMKCLYCLYVAHKMHNEKISTLNYLKWLKNGRKGYKKYLSFEQFNEQSHV